MQRAVQVDQYLSDHPRRVFDWGYANCCHFAGRWVQVVTGKDPMEGLPATPTEFAARRLIVELGGSLVAAWTKQLGTDPILSTLAQIGDIVLVKIPNSEHEAVGICIGRKAVFVNEEGGLCRLSMEHATCAWRLGVSA